MKASAAHFTAAESHHECEGCIFERERTSECKEAAQIAKRLDLPDCEDRAPSGHGYIYVLTKSDPRQLRIATKDDDDE